ncbi:type II secretion system F family protein [Haloplanus pelagicus]|jgi:Flp pilus assembly protein TadB|uniref:type II secretion system F family protein n=1 Tax=Haloplanus pelagicus TaxID=2949995 RepID=UPI00203A6460|nr:type II secretion system protein [Haloplanus sp. HW8-1]
MSDPAVLVRWLAPRWPWPTAADPALDRALTYLGVPIDAPTLERAVRVVATVVVVAAVGLGGVAGALITPRWLLVVTASGMALGVALPLAANRLPRLLARLSRTRALGGAAGLVGRGAMRLRIDPTVERAAAFAAQTGTGTLARSLDEHVRRASGTPRSGFEAFADEWDDDFPALGRAVSRLEAAASAPADERGRQLDRALSAALDGAREELAAFTGEIRGPVTALYAFGILLPLALIGVLPAARATGARIPLAAVVVLYDVVLPIVVVVVGAWLLARRPIAFPPPRIDSDHPETPDDRLGALVGGAAAGAAGGVLVGRWVAPWGGPIAAVGLGIGVALVCHHHAARQVRERVLAVESGLHDALYLVGRRVASGEAVEVAIADAAGRLDGATAEVLDAAVARQRRLGHTVTEAFRGEGGPLTSLPSRRIEEVTTLFGLAATEGRPAGSALVATAEHLEELRRVERDARRELARVTDTLSNTAAVFGPLVGGATVALSARVSDAGAGTSAGFGASALPTAALGIAVGAYVLWLAAVLTVLSSGLTRGLDRTLVGYRVGAALCLATLAYFAAYVGAGLFL